jgi:UPF0755 protein
MSQFGLIPDEDEASHDGRHSRHRRPPRKEKRHSSRVAVVISLLVIAALLVGGAVLAQNLVSQIGDTIFGAGPEDYPGPGSGQVRVVVQPGQNGEEIAGTLFAQDVIASAEAFTSAAALDEAALAIQPGTYVMPQQIPAADALGILVEPSNRVSDGVTVREGLRVPQVVDAYVEQAGMSRPRLEAALTDTDALGLPAYADGEPEGFLFPATYEVEPGTSEAQAMAAMTAKFDEVADRLRLERRARELGYTPREIVTVASIIQAEARLDEDFGKVARVIYNRLDDGLALQMDSTVAFANDVFTVFTTDEQRAIRSPYNTYRVTGLPPGPINSPGEQALEAALSPTDGPWRFFVTVNLDTGETAYSTSFAKHQRNVAKLQQWIRDNP